MKEPVEVNLIKLTPDEFRRLAQFVYDKAGIHLPDEKLTLLSNRLRKRLRALGLATYAGYEQLLKSKEGYEAELPHFLSAVTTNETYFFRNEQLWRFFIQELIPYFQATRGTTSRSLRIWSAASSSGEEAYTAAIALRENLPDFERWDVKIIGTDISRRVLDHAAEGVYNDYAVNRMSKQQIARWFEVGDGAYRLRDEIRRLVRFQFHNLRDPFPNARFDLVFLRNVLMYFDTPMKKRVIKTVSDALAPGGLLIVGDVDSIRTVPELNEAMTLAYQRPGTYQKPPNRGPTLQAAQTLVQV